MDCWRFYPDAGAALVRWAVRSGYRPALLESFTAYQKLDVWSDFVAVFVKDEAQVARHPRRMLDRLDRYMNGRRHGEQGILCAQEHPEDGARLRRLTGHPKGLG